MVPWYFTVDGATFYSETVENGQIRVHGSYCSKEYEAVVNKYDDLLNPTAPASIAGQWNKCIEWDLLGQGEPQGDILEVDGKNDGNALVLSFKRKHGKFVLLLGSLEMDVQTPKSPDTTAPNSVPDPSKSTAGVDKHLQDLIEQVHAQNTELLKQKELIARLKQQLEEVGARQKEDRRQLISKALALINTKKRKIAELQVGDEPVLRQIKRESSSNFEIAEARGKLEGGNTDGTEYNSNLKDKDTERELTKEIAKEQVDEVEIDTEQETGDETDEEAEL